MPPEEAAEAIGVTLLMGGGPSSIYAPRAYAAFVEFYDPRDRHSAPDAGVLSARSRGTYPRESDPVILGYAQVH